MLLPRTSLSAVAIAAFLHSDVAVTAAVPVVVNRAMAGYALGDLYFAVKKYLAPKNAYVCAPPTCDLSLLEISL